MAPRQKLSSSYSRVTRTCRLSHFGNCLQFDSQKSSIQPAKTRPVEFTPNYFSWTSKKGGGCLVGSANLTSAAFDGRNVEACLLLKESGSQVDQLFDKELTKRPVVLDDFEPGSAEPLESKNSDTPALGISTAVLLDANHIRVSYSHSLEETPKQLRLAIRTTGEGTSSHKSPNFGQD